MGDPKCALKVVMYLLTREVMTNKKILILFKPHGYLLNATDFYVHNYTARLGKQFHPPFFIIIILLTRMGE